METTLDNPKAPPLKPEVVSVQSLFGKRPGYIARLCGWESSFKSATKEGAIASLRRQLEQAAKDDYAPDVFAWRGFVILSARHPVYGWGSRIIQYPDVAMQTQQAVSLSSSNSHDRRLFREETLYHLAQLGWQHNEPLPEIVPLDRQRDFEIWMEFQNRHHQAVTMLGLKDQDAHDYAGRNPARPELWAHREALS